jgi:hypothetical protein
MKKSQFTKLMHTQDALIFIWKLKIKTNEAYFFK